MRGAPARVPSSVIEPTSSAHVRALRVGRRSLAFGVVSCALACARAQRKSAGGELATPTSPNVRLLEYDLGPQPWGRGRAVVVVPTWGLPEERFPLLVALHGRGEALKAPAEGAMGWPRDYAMIRAIDRLRAPPLTSADYEGWVEPAHLAAVNGSLERRPLRGVVVACPWMPDLDPTSGSEVASYAQFVTDVLLPRVRRDMPAVSTPESTGIDGVSLGGAVALRIGLTHPDVFGAVGGIQPALADGADGQWSALAESARARRPDLKLRLLTSKDDYFHDAIAQVSRAWNRKGVAHEFAEVPGPHDVVFNRGPGSIELLLWHDRALQRP